jgi:hypothetical protein
VGNVLFNIGIDKTVNINKNVNVNVNKNVQTNVDLNGSLASAEASADAVGGGGGGGGGATLDFLLDDGSDLQTTVVNSDVPENTGVAPGDDFPPPIFDPDLPDGQFFNGTDIPEARLRTFHLDLLDPDAPGTANLRAGQAGDRLGFSNDDETASNQDINWESTTPFSVIVPDSEFSLTNNVLVVEDIIFNPGEGRDPTDFATLRVEIEFTDADGDSEAGAVYFTDDPAAGGGFVDGQDFVIPLGFFNGTLPNPAAGTVLAPGIVNVDADPGNPALDFDELVNVELRVLDSPETGSFANPNLIPGENPSTGGTDVSIDLIRFFSEDEDNDVFNIAETETFAQVTENGAFSFSDALAATNAAVLDDLI